MTHDQYTPSDDGVNTDDAAQAAADALAGDATPDDAAPGDDECGAAGAAEDTTDEHIPLADVVSGALDDLRHGRNATAARSIILDLFDVALGRMEPRDVGWDEDEVQDLLHGDGADDLLRRIAVVCSRVRGLSAKTKAFFRALADRADQHYGTGVRRVDVAGVRLWVPLGWRVDAPKAGKAGAVLRRTVTEDGVTWAPTTAAPWGVTHRFRVGPDEMLRIAAWRPGDGGWTYETLPRQHALTWRSLSTHVVVPPPTGPGGGSDLVDYLARTMDFVPLSPAAEAPSWTSDGKLALHGGTLLPDGALAQGDDVVPVASGQGRHNDWSLRRGDDSATALWWRAWEAMVGADPAFGLVLTAPAASLLAARLDLRTCSKVIYLVGASRVGKTTAATAALAQVSHHYAHVATFDSTATGAVAARAAAGDLLVVYDDTANRNLDITRLIYSLANGRERGRADRSGAYVEPRSWRGWSLLTGEGMPDLEAAGAANRVLPLRIERGWTAAPGAWDVVQQAISKAAGTLLPAMVAAISAHIESVGEEAARQEIDALAEHMAAAGMDRRAATTAATLIYAAHYVWGPRMGDSNYLRWAVEHLTAESAAVRETKRPWRTVLDSLRDALQGDKSRVVAATAAHSLDGARGVIGWYVPVVDGTLVTSARRLPPDLRRMDAEMRMPPDDPSAAAASWHLLSRLDQAGRVDWAVLVEPAKLRHYLRRAGVPSDQRDQIIADLAERGLIYPSWSATSRTTPTANFYVGRERRTVRCAIALRASTAGVDVPHPPMEDRT